MKRTNNQQTNWPELINNFQESGLSAAAWCRENNLKPHQLYYRLDKANGKKQAEPKWLALDEPEVSTIIINIGPATIEVNPGFDPALLAAVVRTLQSIC